MLLAVLKVATVPGGNLGVETGTGVIVERHGDNIAQLLPAGHRMPAKVQGVVGIAVTEKPGATAVVIEWDNVEYMALAVGGKLARQSGIVGILLQYGRNRAADFVDVVEVFFGEDHGKLLWLKKQEPPAGEASAGEGTAQMR
jgi:hypothetical protein